jgi:hypothetical protein
VITGYGDIASILPKRDDLLFFASGVSNSLETRESEYEREIELLMEQPQNKRLVYFSTLASFYSSTRYTEHKRDMEEIIKEAFDKYCIIRIGNITWGTNPHTLINYLKAHPDAEIKDEYRYVVDKEELLHWVNLIPTWNCEMNVPGKMMKVREIKDEYC